MAIAKIALLGLGTMGPGMAAVLARAGLTVTAYDPNAAQRDGAPSSISAAQHVLDRLGTASMAGGSVRICASPTDCLADADLIIENVPESLELKRTVIAEAISAISPACIVASDTSGIPITALQQDMAGPDRIVGMHWSNPPHLIPMIEVIAGQQTSERTRRTIVALVRSLGLVPVEIGKDVPGFVENRILYAIMREAVDLVERGVVSPEDLDTCVRWGIGYKLAVIGPMALLDVAGLDIYEAVSGYLNASLCARDDVPAFITERTAAGKRGIKSGEGIFAYRPEDLAALRTGWVDRLVEVRRALEA